MKVEKKLLPMICRSEHQKHDWEVLLQQRILQCREKISPRFTTIPVSVLIDGRTQVR